MTLYVPPSMSAVKVLVIGPFVFVVFPPPVLVFSFSILSLLMGHLLSLSGFGWVLPSDDVPIFSCWHCIAPSGLGIWALGDWILDCCQLGLSG